MQFHETTEFDPTEYVSLIVPGQGKLEGMTFTNNEEIEEAVRAILENVGEDPAREGLRMITSAMRGVCRSDPKTRAEFMGHIDRSHDQE